MRKTFGGSKKSRRLRNRRRAKSRRRRESRLGAVHWIGPDYSISSESSSSSSSPENIIDNSLRNNPNFIQIMSDPMLSEYYASFNLIPGRKYRINNDIKELLFAGETYNKYQGQGYIFIYLENGEPVYMSNGKPLTQTIFNIDQQQITFTPV